MIPRDLCPRGHDNASPDTRDKRGGCRQCGRDRQLALNRARGVQPRPASYERAVCPRGHDNASPYTREPDGSCRQCGRDRSEARKRSLGALPRAEFCRNGHPRKSELTGPRGECLICQRAQQRKYRQLRKPDPLGHSRRNETNRIWQEGKRRSLGVKPRNWSAETLEKRRRRSSMEMYEVDPAPFLEWLESWQTMHPGGFSGLAACAGSAPRSASSWRAGSVHKIRLDVIDRYLIAAGEVPAVLDELYPMMAA